MGLVSGTEVEGKFMDSSVARYFDADGALLREMVTTVTEDNPFDYLRRHTEITAYNRDFMCDDEAEEIGKFLIIPDMIESVSVITGDEEFMLLNLEMGASYWIKSLDYPKLISPEMYEE